MPEIKFLQDERGIYHAYDALEKLWDDANASMIDSMFPTFIQKGLENLESTDEFPVGKYEDYYTELTIEYNGKTREFFLVKSLMVNPIYELRVDWNWNCKFRAIFFPYTMGDKKYYCFIKAFIKTQDPKYDPTDIFRDEAKRIYEKVRKNPNQYLS